MGVDVFQVGPLKTTSMVGRKVKNLLMCANNAEIGNDSTMYATDGGVNYVVPSGKKLTLVGWMITGDSYGATNGAVPPGGAIKYGPTINASSGTVLFTPLFITTTTMPMFAGLIYPCYAVLSASDYLGWYNNSGGNGKVKVMFIGIEENA